MKWILDAISEQNRLTNTRKKVAKFVGERCRIFSAADIRAAYPTLDKVSVYRTLDMLCDIDVIHPVMTDNGIQYYERHDPQRHHHHAVCNTCGAQKCIDCPVGESDEGHHTLVFHYVCNKCK